MTRLTDAIVVCKLSLKLKYFDLNSNTIYGLLIYQSSIYFIVRKLL